MQYYLNKIKEKWLFAKAKQQKRRLYTTSQAQAQPIFIVSSGRAGTTLLRKMLMQGGELHIPPESADAIPRTLKLFVNNIKKSWKEQVEQTLQYFSASPDFTYWNLELFQHKQKLLDLPQEAQTYYSIIDYIYQEHALKYQGKPMRWGDKTPYLVLRLEWLKLAFPNATYIHLMRDGRDVVCSRMKSFKESLEQAANRWLWSIKEVDKQLGNYPRFVEVRYEDLVQHPKLTLQKIAKIAALSFSEKMLANEQVNLGDDVLAHHEHLNKAITTKAIAKWKQQLTAEQIQELRPLLQKDLEKKGYLW